MKGLAGCVDVGGKAPYYCLYLYGTVKFFSFSDYLVDFDSSFYKKVDVSFIIEQPSALSPTESTQVHS